MNNNKERGHRTPSVKNLGTYFGKGTLVKESKKKIEPEVLGNSFGRTTRNVRITPRHEPSRESDIEIRGG